MCVNGWVQFCTENCTCTEFCTDITSFNLIYRWHISLEQLPNFPLISKSPKQKVALTPRHPPYPPPRRNVLVLPALQASLHSPRPQPASLLTSRPLPAPPTRTSPTAHLGPLFTSATVAGRTRLWPGQHWQAARGGAADSSDHDRVRVDVLDGHATTDGSTPWPAVRPRAIRVNAVAGGATTGRRQLARPWPDGRA